MTHKWDELTEDGWELSGFEGNIPDIETGHRLDVQFERIASGRRELKSVEMKNWKEARPISGTVYKQFEAYIASNNEFVYYFSDGLTDNMKQQFANVFKDAAKAKKLFNMNRELFEDMGILSDAKLHDFAINGQLADLINWVK